MHFVFEGPGRFLGKAGTGTGGIQTNCQGCHIHKKIIHYLRFIV